MTRRSSTRPTVTVAIVLLLVGCTDPGTPSGGTDAATSGVMDTSGSSNTESTGDATADDSGTGPETTCAPATEISADISVDTTLDGCYLVTTFVRVNDAATLSVAPGTTVMFADDTRLQIEDGALSAIGTADEPIIFRGQQPTPGAWAGLVFFNSNNIANELGNVVVEHGGGDGANLVLSGTSRIRLRDSTLRQSSGYAIEVERDTLLDEFHANTLTENVEGPAMISVNLLGQLDTASSYVGNDVDQILATGGTVDTEQTWQDLGVPYVFSGFGPDIRALLTIAPGTTLIAPADSTFEVVSEGTLVAVGTEAQPIVFTSEQPTPGAWHGLQFSFNSNPNELDFVVIEYGGGRGNGDGTLSVFGQDGRLSVLNTTVRHSGSYGFDFGTAAVLTIQNLTATQNHDGAGIMSIEDSWQLEGASDYSGNTVDFVTLRANGIIDNDQTIPRLNVPYAVRGSTTIRAAVEIEAGTELAFDAGGGFSTAEDGSLRAVGTAEAPIVFTGLQQTPGYWDGLHFSFSDSLANQLENCVVEYAGDPSTIGEGLVVVFGQDARVDVRDCALRQSATNGIWLNDATGGTHTGNTFSDIMGEDIFVDE